MAELARPVGLGLAARGSVDDVVSWARQAEHAGLDSVWFHESYFERDAVTYAAAVASHVPRVTVALGAVTPLTRHPVLTAMTVSALDDMAPGRIVCALGTGLPLRLAQMGVAYSPASAVERLEEAMALMRRLWRGERQPSAVAEVPDLVPMFPPVHHVPMYVAGYRSAMVELAGRVADGYLARPAESLPSLVHILDRLRKAEAVAGRPPGSVRAAGYLLSLVGPSRREALNRAKREPFVIYMMSVLSDVSLDRAGMPRGVRDEVAAAWRAEEYHRAAELLPDELVEAFILCGTADEIAERASAFADAGLQWPLLQPVVQDDEQVAGVIAAAAAFGAARADPTAAPAAGRPSAAASAGAGGAWRRLAALWEVTRPFSLTASSVPVAAGLALAGAGHPIRWTLAAAVVAASVLLQVGTNVVNEIYDVRRGVDSITSPRASLALLKGRLSERQAFGYAALALVGAVGLGGWMIAVRGWPVAVLGVLGLVGGVGYTAPPLRLKYRALGLPVVFTLMGPVMVAGTYYVVTGTVTASALVASLPIGLLVTAILHGNEWRDIAEDARVGVSTLSIKIGGRRAYLLYLGLVLGAYLALVCSVLAGAVPTDAVAGALSLPLLVRVALAAALGARGERRPLATIDLATAQLHALFGSLLVAGLVAAAV
ncbi:MAG TPA: LLM class flavin-dependent oxidoreductase [Acidimicrobiales bacterium]|nr:LLM class flavin-dependent oxidoreductase [Acidimicrobiales bacterium]